MFSKELENLIQATLEDGILEENEKAALVKRAQAEGVDLAELEIYINSLLQKRQRELNEKKNAEYSAMEEQKKQEYGKVCPACGRQVPSLSLVCECGYEFKQKSKVSSVDSLSKKLNGVTDDDKFIQILTLFPVPNTKEDIMEFLALATPNCKTGNALWGTTSGRMKIFAAIAIIGIVVSLLLGGKREGLMLCGCFVLYVLVPIGFAFAYIDSDAINKYKKAAAWRAKFDQVLMKGRSLRGDAEFSQMLDYYENQVNKK